MIRHLLIGATLVVVVACGGSDPDHGASSCPKGLSCDDGPGGAGAETGGEGGASTNTGGMFGAGGSTGGVETGSGGSTASTLPERCTVIDGSTASELVANGALLVDVRTPAEYAEGHVSGAVNIPLDELPDRLDELPTTGPIVVYCRSGNRSAQATSILCDAGLYVLDVGAMSNYPE